MAKNKKPRKAYNPNKTLYKRPPCFRYTKEEGEELKTRAHMHLDAFAHQKATAGDYLAVRFRVEVGLKLLTHFHYEDAVASWMVLKEGSDILDKVRARRTTLGRWAMGDPEVTHLRTCLFHVEEVQDKTTRVEQMPAFVSVNANLEHSLFEQLP